MPFPLRWIQRFRTHALSVHLAPMGDCNHKHNEALVLDPCDYAEIPDPVPPKPSEIMRQRVSEAPGVFCRSNALAQISKDQALGIVSKAA